MAKKDQKNEVKEAEKEAEKAAEAEGEQELKKDAAEQEAGTNPDEKAQEGAAVEEAAGAEEETPAEVEAINTDNQTAQESTVAGASKKEEKPEPKKEEPQPPLGTQADQPIAEKPEPTGKFKDLIKDIEGLTTLELAELVKVLEERFGVSAAAPVAISSAPAAGDSAGAPEEEEKANFTVVLADSGAQKIAVIKALREINQELGLKEAKDLADNPPKEVKKDIPKAEAEVAKKKLEAAGAKVELK